MPATKKKRKKGGGKFGQLQRAIRAVNRKAFVSPEERDRALKVVLDSFTVNKGHHLLTAIMVDEDAVNEKFIQVMLISYELNETTKFKDFSRLLTFLMIGALLHKRLGIAEKTVLDDLGFSAYMLMTACRLRCKGNPIPDSTLESIRDGLKLAQDIVQIAFQTNRIAYTDMLKSIDMRITEVSDEEQMLREKYLFGRYHKTVMDWEREGAFTSEILKEDEEMK